jgi:UDP-3-O-[3-hydroxymyristoyl] glucosamine N-acyltransferase
MNRCAQTLLKRIYTLEEVAQIIGAQWIGRKDFIISGIADLESAQKNDLTFFQNPRYSAALKQTQAGAVIAAKENLALVDVNWLIHDNPSLAFQSVIQLFCKTPDATPYSDIHPSAVIDSSAKLGKNITIGPLVIIGPRSIIGADCYIGPGSVIGADVEIGDNCLLHPNVTIRENCTLHNNIILQPGCVIGSCGYGYSMHQGCHLKLEQLGQVILEDDVEIGANTTIDRARFKTTVIGKGSKIDNLVMIAHGVKLGAHNLIVGQAGIAGSSQTGDYVVLGGQAGIVGHLRLEDHVMVAAQSGVTKNLKKGTYGGSPAMNLREWQELQVGIRSIAKLTHRIKQLESEIEKLNASNS